jgi:hypothetical protein
MEPLWVGAVEYGLTEDVARIQRLPKAVRRSTGAPVLREARDVHTAASPPAARSGVL